MTDNGAPGVPELAALIETMDPADAQLVVAIFAAADVLTAARLLRYYYRDGDRSDRTPRGILYAHIGMLTGLLVRLMGDPRL